MAESTKQSKSEILQIRITEEMGRGLDDMRRVHPDIPTRVEMGRICMQEAIDRFNAKMKREGK